MTLAEFLDKLNCEPENIKFDETMAVIDAMYLYTPTAFANGNLYSLAGENEGSCKLFSFAKLHKLNQEKTLACFGEYYWNDVLNNPSSTNHQNIRSFMQTGWRGISFENDALTKI